MVDLRFTDPDGRWQRRLCYAALASITMTVAGGLLWGGLERRLVTAYQADFNRFLASLPPGDSPAASIKPLFEARAKHHKDNIDALSFHYKMLLLYLVAAVAALARHQEAYSLPVVGAIPRAVTLVALPAALLYHLFVSGYLLDTV